jgi:hypothetical protein
VPNAVSSAKVKDGSLQRGDFASDTLLQGPRGLQGPKGDTGTAGAPGVSGLEIIQTSSPELRLGVVAAGELDFPVGHECEPLLGGHGEGSVSGAGPGNELRRTSRRHRHEARERDVPVIRGFKRIGA